MHSIASLVTDSSLFLPLLRPGLPCGNAGRRTEFGNYRYPALPANSDFVTSVYKRAQIPLPPVRPGCHTGFAYGPANRDAVMSWQRRARTGVDGAVGPRARAALGL
jgi:hypothetical protein